MSNHTKTIDGKALDAMFTSPMRVPKAGGARDLADVPTDRLEAVQRIYVNRLKISQDAETMSKMQAVGYELGLRIVLNEIRKDLAKLETRQ
jgi:hypothetical protein